VACGLTHALEVMTLWYPAYWLLGTTKRVTAIVSVATAILMVRLVPVALAIPSSTDLIVAKGR
jgi:two-component system, NtrC family, sensor kinase